jgi:hypothetical protein
VKKRNELAPKNIEDISDCPKKFQDELEQGCQMV